LLLVDEDPHVTLELNDSFHEHRVAENHSVEVPLVVRVQDVVACVVDPRSADVACRTFKSMGDKVKLVEVLLWKTFRETLHYLWQSLGLEAVH